MTADAVGGVWTYALDLSRALAERSVSVALAVMGPRPSGAQRAQAGMVPRLTLHEADFRLEWMDDPWDDVRRAGDWLLGLERLVRPDVIHLNGYCHAALPFRAPVVVVGHSCVLSWFEAVKGCTAPERYDRYRAEVRRGLHAAAQVVAPSAAMLGALQRFYGPLRRTQVIPNGRSADRFDRLGKMAKEPAVLAAGRLWDEAKNLAALDAAASSLPWNVRVAGDARDPAGRELSATHVQLVGPLPPDALAGEMARAEIYALPARYEPFGLSVLEAALARCALVLGDIASLREIWSGCAVFVDPADPRTLSRALLDLIADPSRREQLAARSRARAAELTAARMADSYLATYLALRPPRAEAIA
ncbi:MAG: glycosyltransferase family 4 protein [Myxococcales bacterium]